uniref:Fucosyltransferase n=2 Tax=Tetradesmus obliquus TaxID=3088 RepID=A0A383W237_TETOB|eukprot:jgi/Sobl393_1/10268/SZX71104.1
MEGLAHGSSSSSSGGGGSSLATMPRSGSRSSYSSSKTSSITPAVSSSSSNSSSSNSSSSSSNEQQLSMWDVFPQSGKCNLSPQMREYAQMHAAVVNGLAKPRYLVSVAPQTGAADRLTGTVTQFYFALLSKRAFTAYNPDPGTIPRFAAACDYPLFNWTHPEALPDAVVDAFHTWNHVANDSAMHQTLPAPYNEDYLMLNWNNGTVKLLEWLHTTNLTTFPDDRPSLPYVVSSSNRGATWKMATNPYHRGDFWALGLRPEEAFMCGFFALCRPNAAVQALYYAPFWRPLLQPNVLSIGIQVRFGDKLMNNDGVYGTVSTSMLMDLAAPFFDCATQIETVLTVPGQKVIWYLLSDNGSFRRAAKDRYGEKMLTDTTLQAMHTDCKRNGNPTLCSESTMNVALQHSIGSMLAFSLADYHVISRKSGFGRLGAWLSGRWGNIHEIMWGEPSVCLPNKPAHPAVVSQHGSGV